MGPTGRLVTIKRSGGDGHHFPLSLSTCLFGRGIECDIRIQLPVVSKQHCKIEINEQKAVLFNFSSTNPTQVNGSAIDGPVQLKHGDVITVIDRSFRYENDGSKSTEFPGQRCEQASPRRVSRSSFSSNPDGKVQDPSAACSPPTEAGVSGGPLELREDVAATRPVSRRSEGPATRSTADGHFSEPPGGNRRSATSPTAGELGEGSCVTFVSGDGGLESLPSTQCLEKGGEDESPFRKLYESMKEELDVKSEKENVLQNRRKSGSRGHCPSESQSADDSQGETQLGVSPKSRRRSGRSTQTKATPALGQQASSQTEEERTGEGPGQTLEVTERPSVPPTEPTKAKTPVQCSHQNSSWKRQSGGLSVPRRAEPVILEQSKGFRTDNAVLTPKRFSTRRQTDAKAEDAADFGNTPEKVFSRKRRSSLPPSADTLSIETKVPEQTVPAPLQVPTEKKVRGRSHGTPEQLGTPAGSPGLSSVDVSNLGDSTNKTEGMPLKRRRVSFGGHLRPELFDENLPPNTPLKRGETPMKRRSLVTHSPAVLKKIIKEQSQPSGKEEASEIRFEVTTQNTFRGSPVHNFAKTTPAANDGRRRSSKPSAPSGRESPQQTDVPKRGGRRSSGVPSKRASVDRSQHEILQMIHSRRRSGASEANLIVAKSWADVVKLCAKQTQTKVVRHGPPRQPSKRQRRMSAPKKPPGSVHSEFSTGHANSPCTIVIGKAHIEKVNMPARPYRMLNNFMFNKKIDFNEDLSGLTEMFKTPGKEKPRKMSICLTTFANSEDLLGKQFQVSNSEEKPLLHTPEHFGENVFPGAQNVQEESWDKKSSSPAFTQQCITVNENTRTPRSEKQPLKAASGANKSRRSAELRTIQMMGAESEKEDKEVDTAQNILGRCLRKSAVQAQLLEGEMEGSERSFETCKKNIEPKENSEKLIAVRRSRRSSEPKCVPRPDVVTIKRSQEIESKEDLVGMHSSLRTPCHGEEPVNTENKTTMMYCKSPDPFSTPTKMSTRIKTPSQSVTIEDLSALRKPTQTPGDMTPMHKEPVGGDKSMKALKEAPELKLDLSENVTGCRRRSRTPKRKVKSMEDLAGFKELFQTPDHILEPVTDDKTTRIPCKSPQAEPVNTPTSTKRRFRTPLGKVEVEEQLSALRKPSPGETTRSRSEPEGDDKRIKPFKETPKQKLDSAENETGSRRRSRTPKRKAQPMEDLVAFKELLRTPIHFMETVTDDNTEISCESPQAEPVSTPTSTKRSFRTPLWKVEVEEQLSALRKLTATLGETTQSHREPEDDDKSIKPFKETPKQKLYSAENIIGSRRRSRTPKRKVQPMEDLAGIKELFQTPDHIVETVTDDRTTRIVCQSPQPEPAITFTSVTRQLKTPLGKMDVEKQLSPLTKLTATPGDNTHSHREPFKETPEEQLDSAVYVTGSRRRSKTPKRKVQPMEDLAGIKELFQTPDHIVQPVTDDRSTRMPCKSPKAEPVSTPTSTKRSFRTPLGKVEVEEQLSALRKPPPRETTQSCREPEGDDKNTGFFKETPKQKLDSAENIIGSRRRSRTPKRKVQPMEDLVGIKELFQTPDHIVETVTDDRTTRIVCQSPQPEPAITFTSITRQLKTPLGKMDVEKQLSPLSKLTATPGDNTHSHREPFKETPEEQLDSAVYVTGSRRRSKTPKRKVQPMEDLAGIKELFQTPDHIVQPVTDDKSTRMPCKSPKAEPVSTPTSTKRRFRTPLGKVEVEEQLSALRKPPPRETTQSCREPEGDDKNTGFFKETPKQKLDSAENETGSRRRSRTPKRKAQPMEDLDGFKELFQTPTMEPVTDDKTKIPCKSPHAEPFVMPTGRNKEGLSASRRPTRTLRKTTQSHREPEMADKVILSKETLDSAENVTRSKRRLRTCKEKPLEDPAHLKELFQIPGHTDGPVTGVKTTEMPSKSPQPESIIVPVRMRRQLRAPPAKVDVEEGLSAPRRPTRTLGKTTRSHRGPEMADKDVKVFKESLGQKLDPAENVTGSKRPRTRREKSQPLEDPAHLKELFQIPGHTDEPVTGVKTTETPSESSQPELVIEPVCTRRQLRAPPAKVDMEEGLPAPRRPTRTLGKPTPSHRGPEMADKDVKVFKESLGQKLDAAENVTGSKRPRTRKEKSQPLEDPAHLKELFQIPGHTDEMPSESSQPELVIEPVRMRRQLRAPPAKVDMEEGLPAPRRPTRTLGKPTPSHRGPEMADKDLKVFKESPRQKLGPVENAMVSTRQLRSRKGKAQPLEGPAHCRQLLPSPVQDKELDTGAESIPRTSLQAPDQSKPAKPRRVLRALNGKPGEDLVGSREPVKSQRESSISQPPERSREDGSPPGMRSRRTRTCAQGTAEEKPLQKRQGTDRSEPPGPLKKRQRVWAESTEPVADVPSKDVQTKNMVRDVEDVTFSNKGMSLRSRLPNKTDRAEQRPEILVSAEKVKIKRNEKKPMNASQEVKIQNPEDGATNSVPGDKVHERRRCLRPGRRGKVPLPSGAEEKARERMETQVKTQEEKEGAQRSGSLRLRSRKVMVRPTGDTVQSQPEQRVTRRAKRPAEKSKQENEDACVKKIRTRSRRGCEDI
uniref:Marker of proliferation Ki-67 n=1 Tax=Molossus molossus TaxID=27622 RepID=A0A7J8DQ34_MOLMO|nr:marker of proliferation Ki-67 [Molossus molossus]